MEPRLRNIFSCFGVRPFCAGGWSRVGECQTFRTKGWIVILLGFLGQMVSVTIAELCSQSRKAAIDHT